MYHYSPIDLRTKRFNSPEMYFRANTAQKMKFSIKDFFSKCDQIRSFLRIRSHLLKKSLTGISFCIRKMPGIYLFNWDATGFDRNIFVLIPFVLVMLF